MRPRDCTTFEYVPGGRCAGQCHTEATSGQSRRACIRTGRRGTGAGNQSERRSPCRRSRWTADEDVASFDVMTRRLVVVS